MRDDSRRNSDGVTWEFIIIMGNNELPSNAIRISAAVISHKKYSKSTSKILHVYLKKLVEELFLLNLPEN
jgi:chorismate mutase